MANEYRALTGTLGLGVGKQEHDLDLTAADFSAGAALTIAAGNDLIIIWRKTGTKGRILQELECAQLRVKRALATRSING